MGNEASMMPGLELDPIPLENTDEWTLHAATSSCSTTPQLSIFTGLQTSSHSSTHSLEWAIKNLRVYRHPNILKYLSSWCHQGKLCMTTERVRPLTRVLESQTLLQICVGLHDILKALVFLHNKAQSSHNNVCCAAVYVTNDGSWKLGGLEFLRRFSEINSDFLQKTRSRRYEKAVPPEEDSGKAIDPEALDSFAFGVLVEDVLKKIPNDAQVPGMNEFKDICRRQLQNTEPTLRPKLSQLIDQSLFSHKFIIVHDFLTELPLKSDTEKDLFFRTLAEQLREFPEFLVASQLGILLLGRIVLLDKTAQDHLLPLVLQPRLESGCETNAPLFSMKTYKQFIVPRLLHIFSVRDAQVRLLLLDHFQHFCSAFRKEQLRTKVLPELLVGIKDTNDSVVASTLRALAHLVPILGAATVIGGKRARLFTDGRPKAKQALSTSSGTQGRHRSSGRTESVNKPLFTSEDSAPALPERPSPDGGEDVISATPIDEETDAWSDWDANESQVSSIFFEGAGQDSKQQAASPPDNSVCSAESTMQNISKLDNLPVMFPSITNLRAPLPDISSLDIKNSPIAPTKKTSGNADFNFFEDMEPVISKPSTLQVIAEKFKLVVDDIPVNSEVSSCFDVDLSGVVSTAGEGWGDNDDWGDVSDPEQSIKP